MWLSAWIFLSKWFCTNKCLFREWWKSYLDHYINSRSLIMLRWRLSYSGIEQFRNSLWIWMLNLVRRARVVSYFYWSHMPLFRIQEIPSSRVSSTTPYCRIDVLVFESEGKRSRISYSWFVLLKWSSKKILLKIGIITHIKRVYSKS